MPGHMAQPFEAAVVVATVGQFDHLNSWFGENEVGQARSVRSHHNLGRSEEVDLLGPRQGAGLDHVEAEVRELLLELRLTGQ